MVCRNEGGAAHALHVMHAARGLTIGSTRRVREHQIGPRPPSAQRDQGRRRTECIDLCDVTCPKRTRQSPCKQRRGRGHSTREGERQGRRRPQPSAAPAAATTAAAAAAATAAAAAAAGCAGLRLLTRDADGPMIGLVQRKAPLVAAERRSGTHAAVTGWEATTGWRLAQGERDGAPLRHEQARLPPRARDGDDAIKVPREDMAWQPLVHCDAKADISGVLRRDTQSAAGKVARASRRATLARRWPRPRARRRRRSRRWRRPRRRRRPRRGWPTRWRRRRWGGGRLPFGDAVERIGAGLPDPCEPAS